MVKRYQSLIGKFLYGSLFVVILPIILFYWSFTLDKTINWSVPNLPFHGLLILLIGSIVMTKGMLDLYLDGQGLPMSVYPPKKYVTQGIYSWFPHPIYLGAALFAIGLSLLFQSSSGLYIVTPVLILMMISYVYGYEKQAMLKIFGNSINSHTLLFSLPTSSDKKPTLGKKTAISVQLIVPWLIIGYLIDYMQCSNTCVGAFMRLFDSKHWLDLPSLLWTLPYLYIVFKLFSAKTEKVLRQRGIVGLITTLLGVYAYILLPTFGLNLNNWTLALVITVITILALNYYPIWNQLRNFSEWVANSRHDWLFFKGNFRIINHSIYSGLAGIVGVGIASFILGNNLAAIILAICVIVGATVFAQLLWGNYALLRPFGYWGAILGGVIGILLVYLIFEIPLSKIFLAGILCAPFAQAIGRLRCLVQGCCHGTVTSKELGIRVWQHQSRVVALSGLRGKYILNTQLYSIGFNLLLGLLLLGMWLSHSFNDSIIVGFYLILTGIERFTEDAYRGEKQTRMLWGLRENQWIAISALIM